MLKHRKTWTRKPLLRLIYTDYFRQIEKRLSNVPGPTVELGAGPGLLKTHRPGTLSGDLIPCPWLDFTADACTPPFAPSSLANIVLVDVLHHLPYPRRFFDAACQSLKPGGRVVMLEPYVSPASWFVYRFLHPEPIRFDVDPLDADRTRPASRIDDAWDSNQAIPTILFWRDRSRFQRIFPSLHIIETKRLSMLLYPLSGGFDHLALIPTRLAPLIQKLERLLIPLACLLAYRCLIVLERD